MRACVSGLLVELGGGVGGWICECVFFLSQSVDQNQPETR